MTETELIKTQVDIINRANAKMRLAINVAYENIRNVEVALYGGIGKDDPPGFFTEMESVMNRALHESIDEMTVSLYAKK